MLRAVLLRVLRTDLSNVEFGKSAPVPAWPRVRDHDATGPGLAMGREALSAALENPPGAAELDAPESGPAEINCRQQHRSPVFRDSPARHLDAAIGKQFGQLHV